MAPVVAGSTPVGHPIKGGKMGKINLKYSIDPRGRSGRQGLDLNDIAYIMSSMPQNTVLVEIEQLPVVSLSLDYNITLTNPIFIDGAELTTPEYSRKIGFRDSGNIECFNQQDTVWDFSDVIRTERLSKLEEIDYLASQVENPTKVIMGKQIYEDFKKDLFPPVRKSNFKFNKKQEELTDITTRNGKLKVVVVEEDKLIVE